jgi:hypothetical protein
MNELKSFNEIFTHKIFRIPDYQRGYAWKEEQYKAFWDDLINLPEQRNHYAGVLTLQEVEKNSIPEDSNEFWLTKNTYRLYDVVDGQQRLTTFILFIQAFTDVIKSIYKDQSDPFLDDSILLSNIVETFLYKSKPNNTQDKTYKFGYSKDNPSYKFLKQKIFKEDGIGEVQETAYTLNLEKAYTFFSCHLSKLYEAEGIASLMKVYTNITKKFVFNEYVINNDFDVFVAFETMNNRGKKLSTLELLKNRLIYLITLMDQSLDKSDIKSLRENVNNTWQEIYYQLGRNKDHTLLDDDFLKAHWIMYFMYSRKRSNDFAENLLEKQFSIARIYNRNGIETPIATEDISSDTDESDDDELELDQDNPEITITKLLEPKEIKDYVLSLNKSAACWFITWYPKNAKDMCAAELSALEALNRLGMAYFRPLIMAILKNVSDEKVRINLFRKIERFIFLTFRLSQYRSNYQDSVFYKAARELDKNIISADDILLKLDSVMKDIFDDKQNFKTDDFEKFLSNKFTKGDREGYYGWRQGLHYFLYEYELHLYKLNSRKEPTSWDVLKKTPGDKISIEHIYPQTETSYWEDKFKNISPNDKALYRGSIGNLLLLSSAINSGYQNDTFEEKKNEKILNDKRARAGYSNGSHSEIRVSQCIQWTQNEIKQRGLELIRFMQERWEIRFDEDPIKNEEIALRLLFLPKEQEQS